MGPIYRIEPQDEYNMLIELTSGHKIILDFKEKLQTIRFHELVNTDFFKKAVTDGYSIIWNNGKINVSFGEIMDILRDITASYIAV